MATLDETLEKHHKTIIIALVAIIVVFLFACTFHDILPICHYVFRCDHRIAHAATAAL